MKHLHWPDGNVLRRPRLRGCQLGRPRQHQRGQALIEFTLFFTMMMFMLVGVTDFAFLQDSHLNVVYAARQGARTGAVLGQDAGSNPDCAIVGAVHATLLGQTDVTLTTITIYQVDKTGLATGLQDVYSGTDFCTDSSGSGTWSGGGNQSSTPWAPSARVITPFVEDSIGVRLDYQYQFRFNLLGAGALSLTDFALFPMDVSLT